MSCDLVRPTLFVWLLGPSIKKMLTGSSKAVETHNCFAIDFFPGLLSSQGVGNGSNTVSKAAAS